MIGRKKQTARQRLLELALRGLKATAETVQKEIVELEHELRMASKGIVAEAETLITGKRKRRRGLSAAARKAISLAQKARWAKRNEGLVSRLQKKGRKISTAGRRAASERMAAYWAKRRKEKK